MSRQGKNIYQRKDGRWEGRYIKARVNGKLQYGYLFGRTYKDVEKKWYQVISSQSATNSYSLEAISEEWLQILTPELKASSVARYSNLLKSYIIPRFGCHEIEKICRCEVLSFSRDLLASGGIRSQGLAPKTVNSTLSVLKLVFDYAAKERALSVADIRDISVKQPQRALRILSQSEQERLNDFLCANPTPCHLGILLSLYLGLRIGEVCALRWGDIRINEQYLYVHQTMQRVQIRDSSERKTQIIIQSPKSDCSVRKIPIPNELLRILTSARKQDEAFLLTGSEKSFIEPRSMENQFKAVIRKCDIQAVNYHALRHTFATRCVELGFDIKSLSEILGHANVNITLNRYVHPSMELKQKNMNLLSDLLTAK